MQIILTVDEVAKILLTCFTDGGLELLGYCGIKLSFSDEDYRAARAALKNPCLEDVYIQMLKENRRVYFVDNDNDSEESDLTIEKAIVNLQNPEIIEDVALLLNENGDWDAIPCYRVLQFALYGEVIYG